MSPEAIVPSANENTTLRVSIDVPDSGTLVRILQAFEMDKAFVSQREVDFSTWAVECIMDWVEVVETQAHKPENYTYEHGSLH